MNDTLPCSYGREFEFEIFGVMGEDGIFPHYLEFPEAIQDIVRNPIKRINEADEIEVYNPFSPSWGKTGKIWSSVNSLLPKRSEGGKSGPLSLHISIGRPLDVYHGVDCFFWWMGVYLTIDASILIKGKNSHGKSKLKADILLNPKDVMDDYSILRFARIVVFKLKDRRRLTRILEHKRHPHR